MSTFLTSEKLPNQKDLVLVEVKGVVMPAIYYNSLDGFYHFSLIFHNHRKNSYSKARIKDKFRIEGVEKWCLMPDNL